MTRIRAAAFPWLYVLALSSLFAICISAPPKWHEMARAHPLVAPEARQASRPQAKFAALQIERSSPLRASGPPTPPAAPIEFVALARPHSNIELHRTTEPIDPPSLGDNVDRAPAPPAIETPPTPVQQPVAPPARVQWWPMPEQLLGDLTVLSQFAEARGWAERTRRSVLDLGAIQRLDDPRVGTILAELEDLAAEQNTLLPFIPEGPRATAFRRAGLSLLRRLDVWQELPRWLESESPAGATTATAPSPERLAACLKALEAEPSVSAANSTWRDYLELDALGRIAVTTQLASLDGQHALDAHRLASKVLARLERAGLGSTLPVRPNAWYQLYNELCHWVAPPVEPRQMIAMLEQFETTGLPSDARRVADNCRRLASAGNECQQHLADMLGTHYRNANLRIAISRDFMNRMVQPQPPRDIYIHDSVLGNPTRGWSTAWTDIKFRLVPDQHRARMLLEAHGRITANTITTNTIVKLRSQSESMFIATKELDIGLRGLRSQPAWVEADTAQRLHSVKTDVDFVPVLGLVVQSVAEAEYEDSQPRVRFEARKKISQRVREEMDNELARRIQTANEKFRANLLGPLNQLDLAPELIEAQTSDQRVTLRIRLAADEQLAGHGPRAPADSLASFQIHQSLLNNVAEQLDWEGKTFSVDELRASLAERFHRELPAGASEHPDLLLSFAAENALRLRCRDGRIELTVALAQLKLNRDVWRDFSVRVCYKPDLSGPDGQLQRDGTVQLIGDRLGTKAQIALRSIFSKVFLATRKVTILPASMLTSRPALAELRVTQMDIQDEWIGLALGLRPAEDIRQVRR